MKLRFPESEITYWAEQYLIHPNMDEISKEQELIDLKETVQARGHLTREELYKLAYWKSPEDQNWSMITVRNL